MTTSSPPPKPKRGAPPGNQNARTHGLSPRGKRPLYQSDRSAAIDLIPEIVIMRQHIAALSNAAESSATLSEKIETLRLLTLAVSALTRLVRAQTIVFTQDIRSPLKDSLLGQYLTGMNQYLRTRDHNRLVALAYAPFDDDDPTSTAPAGFYDLAERLAAAAQTGDEEEVEDEPEDEAEDEPADDLPPSPRTQP